MEIEKTISRFQDTISVIGLQSPIALMSLLKSLLDYMVLINNKTLYLSWVSDWYVIAVGSNVKMIIKIWQRI